MRIYSRPAPFDIKIVCAQNQNIEYFGLLFCTYHEVIPSQERYLSWRQKILDGTKGRARSSDRRPACATFPVKWNLEREAWFSTICTSKHTRKKLLRPFLTDFAEKILQLTRMADANTRVQLGPGAS